MFNIVVKYHDKLMKFDERFDERLLWQIDKIYNFYDFLWFVELWKAENHRSAKESHGYIYVCEK